MKTEQIIDMETLSPENPMITVDILLGIKRRLDRKRITIFDFTSLEFWLSSIGADTFILDKFKEHGICSYEEFIMFYENKGGWLADENLIRAANSTCKGAVLGVIDALVEFLNN